MNKFLGKYRIDSIRLKNWDYSSPGYYFVTICTQNRKECFGRIDNGKIIFTDLGKIAAQYWADIPNHFPHVRVDEFVIMPNHIHGILEIQKYLITNNNGTFVETQNFASLPIHKNKFGPQIKNLPSIIRGYKIGVKKWATVNNFYFNWQPRYYEKIIRKDYELNRIRNYIKNNPAKWWRDRNNKGLWM